jgi:hypothetical protein
MRDIGERFTNELAMNLRSQKDLDGKPYWPVTYQTAQARQRRSNAIQRAARAKGVKGRIKGTVAVADTTGSVNQKRLYFTRRLADGAFRFAAFKDYVKVMLWPGTYPESNESYRDIIRWNNSGDSRCTNPRAGKVFPITEAQVRKMEAHKWARAQLTSPEMTKKLFNNPYRKKITIQF